jgi:hypothetical protein
MISPLAFLILLACAMGMSSNGAFSLPPWGADLRFGRSDAPTEK